MLRPTLILAALASVSHATDLQAGESNNGMTLVPIAGAGGVLTDHIYGGGLLQLSLWLLEELAADVRVLYVADGLAQGGAWLVQGGDLLPWRGSLTSVGSWPWIRQR